METNELILNSQIRTEVLTLFNRARTRRQILFAFDSLLESGLEAGINYFIKMLELSNQDSDLLEIVHRKYSQYKNNN